MKNIFTCAVLLSFSISSAIYAQSNSSIDQGDGGEYILQKNDALHPCITPEQYANVEKQCAENIKLLGLNTNSERGVPFTSLNWPLRAASGFNDCSFYVISAYVDQDTASNAIKDWN